MATEDLAVADLTLEQVNHAERKGVLPLAFSLSHVVGGQDRTVTQYFGGGGFAGTGLFEGTQTKLAYVPEQHTDFIFTVAGEELGLLGSAVLIVLLGVVLWRALVIAARAEDLFGRLAAAGIACWFGFQAFQNIGMCMGIMPVTGVPLPFVSYGGSSMFAGMLAVGLLQNIHLRGAPALPTRFSPARVLSAR